jgi:Tfp pilus assembly protein PilN
MIQINLLREPSRQKRAWAPVRWKADYYLGALMVVAVLGMLGWHWHLSGERERTLQVRAELQQQSLQLAAVRAELSRYEAQRNRLEERARIIEQLRAGQKGPVQLLNAIIASLPTEPRLWLTSLEQSGNGLTIQGRAFDVPAIAEFIAELGKHPPFERVELNFWRDEQDSLAFGLNCLLKVE